MYSWINVVSKKLLDISTPSIISITPSRFLSFLIPCFSKISSLFKFSISLIVFSLYLTDDTSSICEDIPAVSSILLPPFKFSIA